MRTLSLLAIPAIVLASSAARGDDAEPFVATSVGGFLCDDCGDAPGGGALTLELGQPISNRTYVVIDLDLLGDTDLELRGALTAGLVGRLSRVYGRLGAGVGRTSDGATRFALASSLGVDVARAPDHTWFVEQRGLLVGKETSLVAVAGIRFE